MDAASFKQQFLPCHAKLYRVAFRLMGNVQDAEDMVQEAYLKLWKKRDELSEVASIEAYCVTLIKNLCYDSLRSCRPDEDSRLPEELKLPTDSNIAREIEQKDEARQVKRLIRQLPRSQQQIILLRDVNDCSYEEIEQVTGLTAVNIRVLLSRARKKIREQFNEIMNYESTTNLEANVTSSVSQNITVDKDMIIQQVYVNKGDSVSKGDKLVSFDMTLVEMELNIARLKKEKQEQDLAKSERRLKALKNGGSSYRRRCRRFRR